jgi:hypothetical protein
LSLNRSNSQIAKEFAAKIGPRDDFMATPLATGFAQKREYRATAGERSIEPEPSAVPAHWKGRTIESKAIGRPLCPKSFDSSTHEVLEKFPPSRKNSLDHSDKKSPRPK